MNDKDKIKFAIRYLKQGLKSKRTPPLYERLMNELGFEYISKEIVELEKENAELKEQIEKMKCCQNCIHYRHFTKDITECAMSFITAQNCRHNNFDKWEIKEK